MSKSDRSSQANLSIKAINQARDEADTTPQSPRIGCDPFETLTNPVRGKDA